MDNRRFVITNKKEGNKLLARLGVGFTSQMLEPRPKDLFSILDETDRIDAETIATIKKAKKEREDLEIEVLNDLDSHQKRALLALTILLHQKSETSNIESPEYYYGNAPLTHTLKGERAPAFFCSIYDFTRIFIGDKAPSGKHLENAFNILETLRKKEFLYKFTETYKPAKKGQSALKKTTSGYNQIIGLQHINIDLGGGRVKKDIKIMLHPIVIEGIKRRFIPIKPDLIKKTVNAVGSSKIPPATTELQLYLLRAMTSKNSKNEIYLSNLMNIIDQKKAKQNRKRLMEYIIKALEICKEVGIILSYEIIIGKTGEKKLCYEVNENYLKM